MALLLASSAFAQPLLPVPALDARVLDQTGTLNASQKATLEARLAALEAAKGSQVVVLMVKTTAPEDIASYANRIGNAWKIGRKDVGDGVLLVVAKDDRKVRIEVAKTLEGAIPDLAAKQIIEQAITPRFKAGDFAGGLEAAVAQIAARIEGEPLPPMAASGNSGAGADGGGSAWELALFAFFALPILSGLVKKIFGRPLGSLLTGIGIGWLMLTLTTSLMLAVLAAFIALLFALFTNFASGGGGGSSGAGAGGWSGGGWSSGGSDGGGFSSGGGGDFGGGGASGDW